MLKNIKFLEYSLFNIVACEWIIKKYNKRQLRNIGLGISIVWIKGQLVFLFKFVHDYMQVRRVSEYINICFRLFR